MDDYVELYLVLSTLSVETMPLLGDLGYTFYELNIQATVVQLSADTKQE